MYSMKQTVQEQFYSRYQENAAHIKPTMLWMCNMQLPHHISIIFLSRMQPFYNVGWLHAHIITQFTTRQQCLFFFEFQNIGFYLYQLYNIPIIALCLTSSVLECCHNMHMVHSKGPNFLITRSDMLYFPRMWTNRPQKIK